MALNLKSLYSADSEAVHELLRVASLLQEAITTAEAASEKSIETELMLFKKLFDVKAARSLVLDIIKAGATLYDDLATEMQLEKERSAAASTYTDIEQIENMVRESTTGLLQTVASVEQHQQSCEKDEKSLQATYSKRKMELERCKKRLSVLQNVRPAYLDEYEALQKDLQRLFGAYLEKFHNLQWLEDQLETHNNEEQEKLQESFSMMKRLQQRVHDENLQLLRGEVSSGVKDFETTTTLWNDVKVKPLRETDIEEIPEALIDFNAAKQLHLQETSEASSEQASEQPSEAPQVQGDISDDEF